MPDPLETIGALPVVQQLPDLLRANGEVNIVGTAGSGTALVAARLGGDVRTETLVVCATAQQAEEFTEDVCLFSDGLACYYPPLEVLPGDPDEPDETIQRARLSVLRHLAFGRTETAGAGPTESVFLEPGPNTRVVVTTVSALMQPTRALEELRRGSRRVSVGEAETPAELVEWLVDHDYISVPQVRAAGQYCLRGGILDVYSHGALEPVRIEFFGDEVDSIRTFDPVTQRSSGRVERCQFTIGEHASPDEQGFGRLLSYFGPDTTVMLVEPERLRRRAEEFYEQSDRSFLLVEPGALIEALQSHPRVHFDGEDLESAAEIYVQQRDSFGPDLDSMFDELGRIVRNYETVIVYCMSPAEADRLQVLLRDREFAHLDDLHFDTGRLNHGALCPDAGLALIPHHRLFGRYRQRRFIRHAREGRPITSSEQLEPGDLVVHVNHGIGRFMGTSVLEQAGRKREHLQIEFAEGVHVHVPCDRIEMVHRYIGVGGRRPDLSRIRGATWRRAKERAKEAVEDLAAELLEMQAIRETQEGIAAPSDTDWMRQFEAEFPYEETEDQLEAIRDVKRDMQSDRPMDRLLCGDVGYGKTEVAMRAAFNAVLGGRQVAMLVPTTVLAQQHFRTFRERMADYPVRIEMLSRFRTDSEIEQALEGMADGSVDIAIGTHRLLQDDVHFKELGLLIIDEEQRFGVEHKEKLKRARATVDVLTLTATPIPRTLHMSLMGLREISALQTPPRDRQAIKTKVGPRDMELVRHAILRELNRDGQVFIIHNRVRTIDGFADKVREAVPEATVAVAHGQMPERELADTMDLFLQGEVDVLVSTTIIENGLDIPNANTIILDRAELLGLAEMHQLRGRVGRYIHKAYAYFFTPPKRPVTPEAQSRLDAIRRYSELGSGFDIALRDLEIRGAGNILGPAQSGHIAAVGYNLYCRLLARASARLQGEQIEEPPEVTVNIGLDAFLPEDYVPTPRQRMELYRQINRCTSMADAREAEETMRDRYGAPPLEARNLLLEAELRILAERAGIDTVQLQDGRLHLGIRDAQAFRSHFAGSSGTPRVVTGDLAVLEDGFPKDNPRLTGLHLKRVLSGASSRPREESVRPDTL
ncbi:MAG: transcription-repair coupling factor [Planctomycetota bacterium]